MKRLINKWLLMGLFSSLAMFSEAEVSPWFEAFKAEASDEELYAFLFSMPKGGDLHNHLSGSAFPEWWLEFAIDQKKEGFVYYTKVKILNCRDYGNNEFGDDPYLLMFRNLQESNYQRLNDCEKQEYARLDELTEKQRQGWLNSLILDKSYEGRNEFFERHWQRMNDLFLNHKIQAEILVRNMIEFGREGLSYLEIDVTPVGIKASGEFYSPKEVYAYYQERLKQRDALNSGVEVRFHYALLRFSPNAEKNLEAMYAFVNEHRDRYVAIDMVGREDNDKGHPLRFLPTLRGLRKKYPGIELSIHAGEVDEPNAHIRNTLLLGANRIGHGVNLLDDPDTFLHMRHGPYLVEINLVSNLLLEYVDDYQDHHFPELLRTNVPVALSTDDRGMFDSNVTDEYFVAVKEFNLSWEELVRLGHNSLAYGFMDAKTKANLLKNFEGRVESFVKEFKRKGLTGVVKTEPTHYGFICRQYDLCSSQ